MSFNMLDAVIQISLQIHVAFSSMVLTRKATGLEIASWNRSGTQLTMHQQNMQTGTLLFGSSIRAVVTASLLLMLRKRKASSSKTVAHGEYVTPRGLADPR